MNRRSASDLASDINGILVNTQEIILHVKGYRRNCSAVSADPFMFLRSHRRTSSSGAWKKLDIDLDRRFHSLERVSGTESALLWSSDLASLMKLSSVGYVLDQYNDGPHGPYPARQSETGKYSWGLTIPAISKELSTLDMHELFAAKPSQTEGQPKIWGHGSILPIGMSRIRQAVPISRCSPRQLPIPLPCCSWRGRPALPGVGGLGRQSRKSDGDFWEKAAAILAPEESPRKRHTHSFNVIRHDFLSSEVCMVFPNHLFVQLVLTRQKQTAILFPTVTMADTSVPPPPPSTVSRPVSEALLNEKVRLLLESRTSQVMFQLQGSWG